MGDKPDDPDKAATYTQQQNANQDALSGKQAVLDDIIARAHALAERGDRLRDHHGGARCRPRWTRPPTSRVCGTRSPGALEDIGEFLGDCIEYIKDNWWNLLHQLVHICANVLAIASIFFPALAPFALGFAIADTLMSGIDWARGVPGAKEAFLTGAVGLVGGFAVGKAASSFMEVAGPSLATGPFRVMASGGAGTRRSRPRPRRCCLQPVVRARAGRVHAPAGEGRQGRRATRVTTPAGWQHLLQRLAGHRAGAGRATTDGRRRRPAGGVPPAGRPAGVDRAQGVSPTTTPRPPGSTRCSTRRRTCSTPTRAPVCTRPTARCAPRWPPTRWTRLVRC